MKTASIWTTNNPSGGRNMDSIKLVNEFCKAWERRDLDELMGFFADDAVYHNIPMQPARGKDAIRAVINSFLPMAQAVEFKIFKSATDGNLVFNERVDIFDLGGGKKVQ